MSDDTTLDDHSTDESLPIQTDPATGIDHEKAQRGVRLVLDAIGEDPDRAGLTDTWQRRIPEMLETLTEGDRQAAKPTMRTFEATHRDLVVKTGIPVYSLCEHHMLPYHGTAHVAYRPDDEVVGLSKLIRYVRWQSRRLTVQEELTRDIARGLADELDAGTVLVEISATHMCEAMRGIETETTTTTREIVGEPTAAERERFTDAIARTDGETR
ncbi:GTP cyclohydrolase I [Halapricum desulfuricans]|uniref:GTP cyclohydrolase I n=1 Tax=Halapricum desulfuricans TaxID=2841257 RepID=A0A897NFV3_9EURY|nr:GTP cyclohydrolase I FolE [Halapricum desulfuricans]QSG09606.1 GTP cyclohydrolase I [Halapricum desulfuricans]QSG11314.1 GTP cyclohydrolase I [Halapricum desulfuricans]